MLSVLRSDNPTCDFLDAFEVGAIQVRQRRQVIVARSLEGRYVLRQPQLPQPRVYRLWVCSRDRTLQCWLVQHDRPDLACR